jgi:hypothetical protein
VVLDQQGEPERRAEPTTQTVTVNAGATQAAITLNN